jgi:molybdopterin-containing oxidoreductase family iron-sulfur binding subunit
MWWNRVDVDGGEEDCMASGTYPNSLKMGYVPVACQHCDVPSCVAVCPTGATAKDPATGIVTQDVEVCIGCQKCIEACPYGVRSYNAEEPEYVVDFSLGDADAPKHKASVVEKCTFCGNRIARGLEPACMELCLARARFWGDLDDPESAINQYVQGKETYFLLEEEGTAPTTIYVR